MHVEIAGTDLSDGLTSDSGVWYAPNNDTFYILFVNMDTLLFRGGFITREFEVNVEPVEDPVTDNSELSISNFNPIIIVGISGFIITISVFLIKRRMRENTIFFLVFCL